jgi:hypothetical protein
MWKKREKLNLTLRFKLEYRKLYQFIKDGILLSYNLDYDLLSLLHIKAEYSRNLIQL